MTQTRPRAGPLSRVVWGDPVNSSGPKKAWGTNKEMSPAHPRWLWWWCCGWRGRWMVQEALHTPPWLDAHPHWWASFLFILITPPSMSSKSSTNSLPLPFSISPVHFSWRWPPYHTHDFFLSSTSNSSVCMVYYYCPPQDADKLLPYTSTLSVCFPFIFHYHAGLLYLEADDVSLHFLSYKSKVHHPFLFFPLRDTGVKYSLSTSTFFSPSVLFLAFLHLVSPLLNLLFLLWHDRYPRRTLCPFSFTFQIANSKHTLYNHEHFSPIKLSLLFTCFLIYSFPSFHFRLSSIIT